MITFIVGTDTNVGKTFIGCKLAENGHKVIKPIETGKEEFKDIYESDSGKYARIQNISIDDVNLYFFNKPMSPHIACELEGKSIDIELIKQFINKHENTYVELAGGLYVPITKDYTQLDLIKSIPNSDILLVVENKLGAINHTLLTCEVLKANNINIKDIIFNDKDPLLNKEIKEDNIKTIKNFT